jgi:hypothetical protein
LLCSLCASGAHADAPLSPAEWEALFNAPSAASVNEGELVFLPVPPGKLPHTQTNRIRITADSLVTGWTHLDQCHDHLDAVARLQIVFREGYVRDLRITEARGMQSAWVEGHSVQLRNLKPGARLCLSADTRALKALGDGAYGLSSGPFMRRFLDGYYPMHVRLELDWPAGLLQFAGITPEAQPGFQIQSGTNRLVYDAWFEGQLHTRIAFKSPDPP